LQLVHARRRQMMEQRQMRVELVALGRKMFAAHPIEPALVAPPEKRGDDDRCRLAQISTWLPSSTTRLVGRRKNSIALSALRSIQANSFSRHSIMPGRSDGNRVWRDRKKLVSIILKSAPHSWTCFNAAGTSTSSIKP